MTICSNCRVELEEDMLNCPLCGEAVKANEAVSGSKKQVSSPDGLPAPGRKPAFQQRTEMSRPQKKLTWEIISIILLSGIIATFIIDFILNKGITWSEFPIAISLTIFAYISLFAFGQQSVLLQIGGGFALSLFFLFTLDLLTGGISWSVRLGIPLLLAANLIVTALIVIIRSSKYKGINLIAWAFLAAALLCLCIEGILAFFSTGTLHLEWSVIVTGSVLPVVLVLFFVHLRLKKGRSLEKTFHI